MRKKYLLSLENRTAKELAEEEALYIELKRIEQNEKRFKQDRDRLLRTLLGAESGLPDLPIDEDGPLGDPKKRKKGVSSELDSPATPSSSLFASAIPRRAQSAKSAAEGKCRYIDHHLPSPSPRFFRQIFFSLTKQPQMHYSASSARMGSCPQARRPRPPIRQRTSVLSAFRTQRRRSQPRSPRYRQNSAFLCQGW